jgi:hypothetical protein
MNLKGGQTGWLKFNLSGVAGDVTLAKVRVHTKSDPSRLPNNPTIYEANDSNWSEGAITWDNQPAILSAIETVAGPFAVSSWIEFDVTGHVGGNGFYSFALTDIGSNKIRLETKESFTEYTAQLYVEHEEAENNPPHWDEVTFQEPNAAVGEFYTHDISSLAYDLDGDELTFSKLFGDDWLTVDPNGTISGTPGQANLGMNNWTVKVEDGNGGSETADMRLMVLAGRIEADVNGDGDINFEDFDFINRYWLWPCTDPNWCEGADINGSGLVDWQDMKTFTQSWDGLP